MKRQNLTDRWMEEIKEQSGEAVDVIFFLRLSQHLIQSIPLLWILSQDMDGRFALEAVTTFGFALIAGQLTLRGIVILSLIPLLFIDSAYGILMKMEPPLGGGRNGR